MKRLTLICLAAAVLLSLIFIAGCGSGGSTGTQTQLTSPTAEAPVYKMVFTTQPGGAVAWEPFKTQPVVTVVDKDGNPVTDYNKPISIGLYNPTGSVQLYGQMQETPVNGVATFKNLYIDEPGTYRLKAKSSGLEDAISDPFEVAPAK
ncbi:MAG: hypothetical protein NUV31_12025 [Dehalococcoidales bacterium]|nr:hypothetical protein [Dehalococcoidales bacterium]